MSHAPEDSPSDIQLLNIAGEVIGCCSLPLSTFGRLAKIVIADLLHLRMDAFELVGTRGKVDMSDMLCEVTEPDRRVLTVLLIVTDLADSH